MSRVKVVALFASLAVTVAACGSSKKAPVAAASSTTAAGGASSTTAAAPSSSAAAAVACTAKIGFMGPFTGDAASIGQEQLNWGKLGMDDFNKANGTTFTLVETDTKLDPAEATTAAQKLVSDNGVVAVLGPSGSQEVEAIGPAMTTAGLVYMSPSATRTSLTAGKIPTFARVVPNDDAQGPTVANFAAKTIGAKKVLIIDDQTSYSTGLADSATAAFKTLNVTVNRESIAQKSTDFSTLVTKVTADTDAVFLPWQIAANGQQLGTQLKEQGKKAVVIGSDGLYSPKDFTLEGAYVTSFAPDVRGVPAAASVVAAYQKAYDDKFGTFGPPVYVAAQLLATGVKATCKDGKPGSRADVLAAVKKTKLDSTILGGPVAFDANGDVVGAKFYLSKITGGKYTLVAG
jgi:branched-chain amino acid transport system substrate-binding protein